MIPAENYLIEKHLQEDSKEPNIEQLRKAARKYGKKLRPSACITRDAEQKTNICHAMAQVISGNFEGWELKFNEPGYSSDCSCLEQGLRSVSVYRNNRFLGHRLIAPEASAEKALAEIATAFLVTMERVKEKEVERKS